MLQDPLGVPGAGVKRRNIALVLADKLSDWRAWGGVVVEGSLLMPCSCMWFCACSSHVGVQESSRSLSACWVQEMALELVQCCAGWGGAMHRWQLQACIVACMQRACTQGHHRTVREGPVARDAAVILLRLLDLRKIEVASSRSHTHAGNEANCRKPHPLLPSNDCVWGLLTWQQKGEVWSS